MIEFENDYDTNEGEMYMECDYKSAFEKKACTTEESFEGEWQECIDQFKKAGWKIRKTDDGEWVHFCPEHASYNY